ncbi:MAG: nucleotidyltransferase family protein [Elusimicrobiota bacterium]|jgi:NDP-sugar pyrophosphorylase family protein
MKAMVLAAGEGRRLRPLTDTVPKALVEAGGCSMLEHVLQRLKAAGVREVILNVCHLADKVEEFVRAHRGFGLRVEFSREQSLLDTGGGLKKAAWFFDDGEPFFLYNADVYCDADLSAFYQAHLEGKALASVAVHKRESRRALLFNERSELCGWDRGEPGVLWAKGPVPGAQRFSFAGFHVISPELLSRMRDEGVFSILQSYLESVSEGERILAHRIDGAFWSDIGRLEDLEALRRRLGCKPA